jgi:hypothetical protein
VHNHCCRNCCCCGYCCCCRCCCSPGKRQCCRLQLPRSGPDCQGHLAGWPAGTQRDLHTNRQTYTCVGRCFCCHQQSPHSGPNCQGRLAGWPAGTQRGLHTNRQINTGVTRCFLLPSAVAAFRSRLPRPSG